MRHPIRTLMLNFVIGALLLVIGFGGGWLSAITFGGRFPVGADLLAFIGPGAGANTATPQELRQQFSVFWEVWNLVESEFYSTKPLDRQRMIHGAIHGMLQALDDQYTVYQEPELAAQTKEHMQGKMGGIGTYLRITDGRAYLYKPIKNSPAVQAGLKHDDELLKVDGEEIGPLIAGLDINEAAVKVAARIRGEEGTQVRLTLRRAADGEIIEVTITRADVVVSSVEGQMLDDGIAYIRIGEFKSTTTDEFDTTMRELLRHQPQGIVLDLRNNPGGYLQNAQDVLGRFYDGVALLEEKRGGRIGEIPTVAGPRGTRALDLPLVVLINGHTASASEIVAGALRDQRPGTYLMGEKTYGKGSVQNIHPLSDGGSARITIAQWLTPNRSVIQKIGITPQHLVPYDENMSYAVPCVTERQPAPGQETCADSQLFWAMKLLTTGEAPPAVAAAEP